MDEMYVNAGWQHLVYVCESFSKFLPFVISAELVEHIVAKLSQRFVEIWCAKESLKLFVVQCTERPRTHFIFTFLFW